MLAQTGASLRLDELDQLLATRQFDTLFARLQAVLDAEASTPLDRAAAYYLLGRAHYDLEQSGEAEQRFDQALDLFTDAGDMENAERTRLRLAQLRIRSGAYNEAQHLIGQSLAIAREQDWPGLTAEALLELGILCNKENRYRDALEVLRPAAEYFAAQPGGWLHGLAQSTLAWTETGLGDLAAGEARAGRLLADLRAAGVEPGIQMQVVNTLVFNACCHGDFELMLERLNLLLELAQASALGPRSLQLMVVHYNTAVCEMQLARFAAAKRSLHRAWDIARRERDTRILPALLMLLSLTALHEDRPAMALEYAELARSDAREFESDESVLINWYLALALLAAGKLDRAATEWAARRPLEPSIENWQEASWMRRALAHLASPAYAGEPPLDAAARTLATAWDADLAALQAEFPAPPALAGTVA
jgi:tetratricopeptide (TPR) repeat protein